MTAGDGAPLRNRLDLLENGTIAKPTDVARPGADTDWTGGFAAADEAGIAFLVDDEGESAPAQTSSSKPCRIGVADPELLDWVLAEAQRHLAAGRLPDRAWMQSLPIPDDLPAAITVLTRWRNAAASKDLENAIFDLDVVAAKTLGLDDEQLAHIHDAFVNDNLLRHTRPQWRHSADRSTRI